MRAAGDPGGADEQDATGRPSRRRRRRHDGGREARRQQRDRGGHRAPPADRPAAGGERVGADEDGGRRRQVAASAPARRRRATASAAARDRVRGGTSPSAAPSAAAATARERALAHDGGAGGPEEGRQRADQDVGADRARHVTRRPRRAAGRSPRRGRRGCGRRACRGAAARARGRGSSAAPTSPRRPAGPATRISSASSPKRTPTSTPGASSSALEQVLDDPVGRQLDAGGQHARAALDGQARVVALVAQDERRAGDVSVGGGEVGASSSRRTPTISRISSSVARLAVLDLRERRRGGRAVAGDRGAGVGQPRQLAQAARQQLVELAREARAVGRHLEPSALVARRAQLLGAVLQLAHHARCGRRRRARAPKATIVSGTSSDDRRRSRSRRRRPCRR